MVEARGWVGGPSPAHSIGNTIDTIGNSIINPIGNSIGNSIETNPAFWFCLFLIYTGIFMAFMKKGLGQIDRKVYTINLYHGSLKKYLSFSMSKNKSANYSMSTLLWSFTCLKLTKYRIDTFLREELIMTHWIRFSLLCRCK